LEKQIIGSEIETKDYFEGFVDSLPPDLENTKRLIRDTFIPILGFLVYHDLKYKISTWKSGYFVKLMSYETILENVRRCIQEDESLEAIIKKLGFFVRLYNKYIDITYTSHDYYCGQNVYRPRHYKDHPFGGEYSEKCLSIRSRDFERFLIGQYIDRINRLSPAVVFDKIQNMQQLGYFIMLLAFLEVIKDKNIIDKRSYDHSLSKTIEDHILKGFIDIELVSNELRGFIYNILRDKFKDWLLFIIDYLLIDECLAWTIVYSHTFNSNRCSAEKKIIISDWLRDTYKELSRSLIDISNKCISEFKNMLKSVKLTDKIRRLVALREIRNKGFVENIDIFADVISDYLEKGWIVKTPNNQGVKTTLCNDVYLDGEIERIEGEIRRILEEILFSETFRCHI